MSSRLSLLARPDTFFGVCEALGEDLGFHANWLRAALGVTVLVSPLGALAAYAALGAAVWASRLLFPARTPAPTATPVAAEPAGPANDAGAVALAEAA